MGAGKAAAHYNAQAFRQGNQHDRAKERAQSGLQSTEEGMGAWLDRETDAKQGLGVDEKDVMRVEGRDRCGQATADRGRNDVRVIDVRSEAHTSEIQSLMRNTYGVLCLNK